MQLAVLLDVVRSGGRHNAHWNTADWEALQGTSSRDDMHPLCRSSAGAPARKPGTSSVGMPSPDATSSSDGIGEDDVALRVAACFLNCLQTISKRLTEFKVRDDLVVQLVSSRLAADVEKHNDPFLVSEDYAMPFIW